MREREEGRQPSPRPVMEDERPRDAVDKLPLPVQSLETLRPGYSWIRVIETRHPGWRPAAVDGFPFTLPIKRLHESRIALVSLAGVYGKGQKPFNTSPGLVPQTLRAMRFRDRGDWSLREIPQDTDPGELAISHAHYDHGDADEDINCVLPLARLRELEQEGFIGEAAPIHYSFMGYVPEVNPILDTTHRQIIPDLKKYGVDGVVISGGCEVSHHSAGLIQREIELAGVPTVAVTLCRDLTYQLQVARAAALRFPLGNPFGSSMDTAMQSRILRDALNLFESISTPGEIQDLDYDWIKT